MCLKGMAHVAAKIPNVLWVYPAWLEAVPATPKITEIVNEIDPLVEASWSQPDIQIQEYAEWLEPSTECWNGASDENIVKVCL